MRALHKLLDSRHLEAGAHLALKQVGSCFGPVFCLKVPKPLQHGHWEGRVWGYNHEAGVQAPETVWDGCPLAERCKRLAAAVRVWQTLRNTSRISLTS